MAIDSLERAIAAIAPRWAMRRAQARQVLGYYEAASPGQTRKARREGASGNTAVLRAGATIREQARHLDQNHDLAIGVLNSLVNFTVGPVGIGIEPQPMGAEGEIHDAFARSMAAEWDDFCRRPEVTWQHDWGSFCRLMARTWYRDGEAFAQLLEGSVAWLDHGTRVPFSLEMIEPDFVPMEHHAAQPLIEQGIEINDWGRPVAYHVYKTDPRGSLAGSRLFAANNLKRIESARMLHVANRTRIRQLRGVSVFASVLGRLDDLKDYEESERVAAKVAASMAAFIRKGQPDMYAEATDATPRGMKFKPGMVFDDLKPGEDIGTIDTNRPNPNLETYRSGQLRAVAAGTGPTYSSIARTYDGTYSSQRQELVEGWTMYAVLQAEFTARIVRPIWERFVAIAVASGRVRIPPGIKPGTENDALFLAPQMPWIDPQREAEAWAIQEDRAYTSGPEIIRKRGGNPMRVLDQQARWLKAKEEKKIPAAKGSAAEKPAEPKPAASPPASDPAAPTKRRT